MNEPLVVFIRGIIGFFTLLILTRALGKQQISQLTFFDYVYGITIGSIAASLTTDLSSKAWPHWVGLITWAGAVFLLQIVSVKSRRFAKYVIGEPTIVIMNGKIVEKAMKKMRYNADDLLEQLRIKSVFDISEVEYAILETNGNLSILKKPELLPLTPKDMNIKARSTGIGIELIYSGKILEQNLKQIDKDKAWLKAQLKKYKVKDPADVFLAVVNQNGKLNVFKYNEKIKKIIDIGDYKGPQ